LSQNYPNPFNPGTTITFDLPLKTFVSLKIFDVPGREVSDLVYEILPAGTPTIQWNAGSARGGLPSGIYFCRLHVGTFQETKKLDLLR
jgi:hypothetical protein